MSLPQCKCNPGRCVTPASCMCVYRGDYTPLYLVCSKCNHEDYGRFPRGWRAIKCVCTNCGNSGWITAQRAGEEVKQEEEGDSPLVKGKMEALSVKGYCAETAKLLANLTKKAPGAKNKPGVGGKTEVASVKPESYNLVTGRPE